MDNLFGVIESRKGGDPEKSCTAKMFGQGTPKIARKVGEEAVETVIEAMCGNKKMLAEESADLLYHLLVLWSDQGLEPGKVWQVLDERCKG
ncbi:phosphoribosyl-ATP diphosphatase [Alphaproteobacteria bacterium]|nr:phosphoribosyl-ATP diphosphatase [Alphaproteobacteria bacterium]